MMTDFVTELTIQLRAWQSGTTSLQPHHVQEMCIRAAAATLGDQELTTITLRHEVQPEDLTVLTVAEFDGETISLWPEDVSTLRALLSFWNEHRPPQVGDPLAIPCRLEDGRVVSEVVEDMLNNHNEHGGT